MMGMQWLTSAGMCANRIYTTITKGGKEEKVKEVHLQLSLGMRDVVVHSSSTSSGS